MGFIDKLKGAIGWGTKHVDVGLDKGVRVSYRSDLPPNWFERLTRIFRKK